MVTDKEFFENQAKMADQALGSKTKVIPAAPVKNAVELLKAKTELAPKTVSIEQLIKESAAQLKMALPEHMRPERIVRIALTTLRMNPKLYQCEPQSFLAALFQSAQLGLEPNLNGEAWIIPYKKNFKDANGDWKSIYVAQFQIGAYGFVKLYWNHQSSVSLQVEKVHEKDEFSYDLGSGELNHKPPMFGKDRGQVIGYYAAATMKNGGRAIKVLSTNEAMQHGMKYSKTWITKENDFDKDSPWKKDFDAMAMKTVLKMLMKILPKSIEIQRALAMDETVKTKIEADMIEVPNELTFNEKESEANEPG